MFVLCVGGELEMGGISGGARFGVRAARHVQTPGSTI